MAKNQIQKILQSPDKYMVRTHGANGVLSRLWLKMLGDLHVTLPRWGSLMADYITDARNGVPNNKKDQTSMRGNLTKEFSRQQMTWKVFCKALRFLQIVKIELVINAHHADGRTTLHSTVVDFGSRNTLPKNDEELDDSDPEAGIADDENDEESAEETR